MLNIFISYSSQNRALVEVLAADLSEMGHAVWYDHELTGGHPWWSTILDRIRRCDLFIFAVTPAALNSIPCQREYGYAHDLHKRILPVWLEDVDIRILPTPLQEIQLVDYRERTPASVLKLTRACNQLPATQNLPDPMPPEPEVPLSPLADAAERVNGPALDLNTQRLLVSDLRELLANPLTEVSARELLKQFATRDDLFAKVKEELATLPTPRSQLVFPTQARLRVASVAYPRSALFKSENGGFLGVAFSADGQSLLTGGHDRVARLWNIASGKEVQQFAGHLGRVSGVAFSQDGKGVLTASWDTSARLWEVETGVELIRYTAHTNNVTSVAFSPNNQYVLTGSLDGSAILWDIAGSEIRRFEGHHGSVNRVCFVPNSRTILTCSHEKTVRLWELETGLELHQFADFKEAVWGLAVAPDGRLFAAGEGNGRVSVWDIESTQKLHQFEDRYIVQGLAFSPDRQFMAYGGTNSIIRLVNLSTGKFSHSFTDHRGSVQDVMFSPDSRALASAGGDGARIWSLAGII